MVLQRQRGWQGERQEVQAPQALSLEEGGPQDQGYWPGGGGHLRLLRYI